MKTVVLVVGLLGLGQEPAKEKAITGVSGKVGDLLRQWWKEGTAAGNVGDYYDNRDGSHSDLDMTPYPQLQKIVYSAEDIKFRRHWAAQRVLLPHVVFGNSSTSAPPTMGGSNPRHYYVSPAGLAFLYRQYTGNNIYMYPEHRDHDPGHNGQGDGFGDLYPTNTPYLIISQGSSGSDQPFMRAVPFTLAAFRPDVKKKLAEAGMLMPTVQMILRRTNKALKNPDEYLTAKAHPSVFEGSGVDDLAMVQMAHELKADNLPPLIQMRVLEEDQATPGKDFFDVHTSEKLGDTPAVIARVFRGKERKRRMVVSAAGSIDLTKKPLTFRWVVLRGDPARVKVVPRNKEGSEAEIVVAYHERRPIAPGSAMESNRVEIGVFAHNGMYHSAPGFITWFSLDNEARTYDDKGRVVEIGYGQGENSFTVTNWRAFLDVATEFGGAAKALNLKSEDKRIFGEVRKMLGPFQVALDEAKSAHVRAVNVAKSASDEEDVFKETFILAENRHKAKPGPETKKAVEVAKAALERIKENNKKVQALAMVPMHQKKVALAEQAINDLLDGKTKEVPHSIRAMADRYLHQLARNPDFLEDPTLRGIFRATEKLFQGSAHVFQRRLLSQDLLEEIPGPFPAVKPRRAAKDRSLFEKNQLERFHGILLANRVFPNSLVANYQVNFVDQRLTAPKEWRDVYRYDAKGVCTGWTRYDGKAVFEFTAEGLLITEKNAQGQVGKARRVRYVQEPIKGFGLNGNPLKQVPGDWVEIE